MVSYFSGRVNRMNNGPPIPSLSFFALDKTSRRYLARRCRSPRLFGRLYVCGFLQNGFGPIKSLILTGKHQALYIDSVSPEALHGIDFNILLVDEVQFFKPADIVALSDIADTQHIPVVCYGLKTDANGHLFDGSAKLLAIADSIKEIKCICPCGAKATMHVRYVDGRVDTNPKPYAIEKGNTTYESVCRKCYKRIKGLER